MSQAEYTQQRMHALMKYAVLLTFPQNLQVASLLKMADLDAKLRWKVHVKKKTGRTRPKIQTNVLVYGKKIGPDNAQEAGTI